MRHLLAILLAVSAGGAMAGPVELPPPGYAGAGFVDSQGCAFARAEVGGKVVWVERLDSARDPVCGETPTVAKAAALVITRPVAVSLTAKKPKRRHLAQPSGGMPGYKPAWEDGRFNPLRGPRTAEGDAAMYAIWSHSVPMVRIAR